VLLATNAKLLDLGLVACFVFAFSVVQQLTTQSNHLQKTTTTVVVFIVGFEVLGQSRDVRSQDSLCASLSYEMHLQFSQLLSLPMFKQIDALHFAKRQQPVLYGNGYLGLSEQRAKMRRGVVVLVGAVPILPGAHGDKGFEEHGDVCDEIWIGVGLHK
jgi:hypothetical protein